MKKYILIIALIKLILININLVKAEDIDLIISPIKYEIQAKPWETITKTAKIINKSNKEMDIYTWRSDFISKDNSWTPMFVREEENTIEWISKWVTISSSNFKLWTMEEKDISFDINIPNNASPGWHYWAIFFKNNNENNTHWDIKINVDYWVLILINVEWEIIDKSNAGELSIEKKWNSWVLSSEIDKCIIDLSKSNTDWKCIDNIKVLEKIISNEKKVESTDLSEKTSKDDSVNNNKVKEDNNKKEELEVFSIEFGLPFENEWNTHIKPKWTITLIDEDWNKILWIWKEISQNEAWAILWENIVDYIPINDNGWNILPNTTRVFLSEWNWFPYEAYDEYGKKIIKYWTPSEYYTKKNIEWTTIIFPWQKIYEKVENKKIKALVNVGYENYLGENVEFNSEKEFDIEYTSKKIWINPYFFIFWWLLIFLLYIIYLIIRKVRNKKCKSCKKSIKKNMKICPYCSEKQK